jgi:sterol 24-C-methyltransferase
LTDFAHLAAIANSGSEHPSVEEYFTNLESRLGYWLFLGNARHAGLWAKGTIWPFPLSKALRAMEEKLYMELGLANGSKVLDAGAGSGIVAAYMAERGELQVTAVDLIPAHVNQARKNLQARGLLMDQDQQNHNPRQHKTGSVSVHLADYHNLTHLLAPNSLDGIYTMEAFVHADFPDAVLQNFHRALKPGGVLVLHEADFKRDLPGLQEFLRLAHCQNTRMRGSYEVMLAENGFGQIEVEDLTDRVLPLVRLFWWVGAVPYHVIKVVGGTWGWEQRFTNMMAGVLFYEHWGEGRYISVRAVKV